MALTDEQVANMAKEGVGFRMHPATYLIINAMLVFIWVMGPRDGGLRGFWPIWTTMFWGIGWAFHAANTYGGMQAKEEEKLRQKHQ